MRILHCIPTLGCGGAERQLSYLAPEMARLGHEVHVAYLKGGINLPPLQTSKVRLHQMPCNSNYDPVILFHILRLFRKVQPDIVQTWILQMDIVAGLVALWYQKPWVLREPNSGLAWGNAWKHKIRNWLGLKATVVVANSQGGIGYWQSLRYKGKSYIISNAIPLGEIEEAIPSDLTEYFLSSRDKLILYVGSFDDRQKNLTNLVEALESVLKEKERLFAIFCGDGPDRSAIENLINRLELTGKIKMPGVTTQVFSLMKRAEVFVSVSHFEGRPNTVLEAIACGTPLVVSDIPAHREFLDHKSALLVNQNKIDDIKKGIENILSEPDKAKERAQRAKTMINQWTIPIVAHNYIYLYNRILYSSI